MDNIDIIGLRALLERIQSGIKESDAYSTSRVLGHLSFYAALLEAKCVDKNTIAIVLDAELGPKGVLANIMVHSRDYDALSRHGRVLEIQGNRVIVMGIDQPDKEMLQQEVIKIRLCIFSSEADVSNRELDIRPYQLMTLI